MRKCLLAVQGPLQFLEGLIAMEWYTKVKHKSADAQTVLLLYDFLCPEKQEQLLVESIKRLSKVRQWDKIVFISSREMDKISRQSYSQSIKDLKRTIGIDGIDEIHISRDYCGFGSALILNAYKQAVRVTYGDSLGLVGDEDTVKPRWWDLHYAPRNIKILLRGIFYGKPVRLGFDAAVLPLPADWTGSYLDDIPLLVPRKEYVLNVIERVCGQLPDLVRYCDLLLEWGSDSYLFLLGNLYLSGLMPRKNELALYVDSVRQVAPIGSRIILKAHPRSGFDILISVVDSLKADYKIKIIDDAQLSVIPIELWVPLINSCRVVSLTSTSAINIAYLYNKDCIIHLDGAKINKYFFHNKVSIVAKVNRMIIESIDNLKKWDGNSLLWKGC